MAIIFAVAAKSLGYGNTGPRERKLKRRTHKTDETRPAKGAVPPGNTARPAKAVSWVQAQAQARTKTPIATTPVAAPTRATTQPETPVVPTSQTSGSLRKLTVSPEAAERVEEERQRGSVVEEFEELVADVGSASVEQARRVLGRFDQLDDEEKRRLSAECASQLGSLLADAGRRPEAIVWFDQAVERDGAYFQRLNRDIAHATLGFETAVKVLPQYPFKIVPWMGLAAVVRTKARVLHELGRHDEVEVLLGAYVTDHHMRYLRAELRRLRGSLSQALADYQAVAAWNADYERVRHWIYKITEKQQALRAPTSPGVQHAQRPASPPRPSPPVVTPGVPSPWDILGVPQTASAEDIRTAYLSLSRQYHPDRYAIMSEGQRAEAEEKMRLINGAWNELARAGIVR